MVVQGIIVVYKTNYYGPWGSHVDSMLDTLEVAVVDIDSLVKIGGVTRHPALVVPHDVEIKNLGTGETRIIPEGQFQFLTRLFKCERVHVNTINAVERQIGQVVPNSENCVCMFNTNIRNSLLLAPA